MFEDDNQEVETSEETQEEVELIEEEDDSTEEGDSVDWKAKALEEEARRKKAEEAIEKAKKKGKTAPVVSTNGLSTADIIALTRANLNDEDVDEVVEYASLKKISISEALKTDIVQATIKIREEKRASANAVHTGTTRRANNGTSDERLLDNARAGKMPENESDMARLAELRLKNRKR